MKWRDRISILSRKRNRRSAVGQPNGTNSSNNLPSGSGLVREGEASSNSASRENVESTLSQLRPVIGPDHKSYYILLRGNGDLFTCIQPAKNVMNSLDDMMKNVMSSVKGARVPDVPTHTKRPRHSQIKTTTTTIPHKHISTSRRNGVGSAETALLGEKEAQVRNIGMEEVYVSKQEKGGLGNLLVCKKVPKSSELIVPEHVRTTVLMPEHYHHYNSVQNRLVSQTCTNNNTVKQEPHPFTQDYSEERSPSPPPSPLIPNQILRTALSGPKVKEAKTKTKVTNGLEEHLQETIPSVSPRIEAAENTLSNVLASMGQNTLHELRLISKEGTVLTEQEIAEQIKTLINTEQLVVSKDTQIIVLRVSEREVIVKLVMGEVQVKPVVSEPQVRSQIQQQQEPKQQQQQQQQHRHQQQQQQQQQQEQEQLVQHNHHQAIQPATRSFLNHPVIKPEQILKQEVNISPSISPTPEEDCFTQDVLVSRSQQDSDLDCFFSPYTDEKQGFESMRGITLDPSLTPSLVLETLPEPLVDTLVNTQHQQHEELPCGVDDLEDIGHTLLQNAGEIVVIQQEDGTLVNQDGIPISTELQYLIANFQQGLTASLEPESETNHILVPPDAFEDTHTLNVKCEL